jgi:capsular polysaccharide transport system ATP-binding protein
MITLDRVSKTYRAGQGRRVVLNDANVEFPTGSNIGILGANGAGKSTLIRLLAGSELPDRGKIRRQGRVSFPLGYGGTFHGSLSGRENIAFIARIYGAYLKDTESYVAEFAELGEYFDMPVNTYSAGMRASLAFGACLAVDFDIYLIDEVTEIGDERFRRKCAAAFRERASAPISSWSPITAVRCVSIATAVLSWPMASCGSTTILAARSIATGACWRRRIDAAHPHANHDTGLP